MALVIRLRQQGRTNTQAFRLVVTQARCPRDGKYLEMLGWYHPQQPNEKNLFLHTDRVQHWLQQGAVISERAKELVRRFARELYNEMGAKQEAKQKKLRAARQKRK